MANLIDYPVFIPWTGDVGVWPVQTPTESHFIGDASYEWEQEGRLNGGDVSGSWGTLEVCLATIRGQKQSLLMKIHRRMYGTERCCLRTRRDRSGLPSTAPWIPYLASQHSPGFFPLGFKPASPAWCSPSGSQFKSLGSYSNVGFMISSCQSPSHHLQLLWQHSSGLAGGAPVFVDL